MMGGARRGPRARVGGMLLVALSLAVAPAASAQLADRWDYRALDLTRARLEAVLARYQAAAISSAYSPPLRAQAASVVDSIRARMSNGDIRVGDRLHLVVEGQPQLSDTFPVLAGPTLVLPVVGAVSLKGVLRSELEARLTASIDSVYRNVTVRAEPLLTLAVVGGVLRPGFYPLRTDALLQDAIGAAGGLAPAALLADSYILRARVRAVGPDSVQAIIRDRLTVGALGLQPGDELYIPVEVPGNAVAIAQLLSYAVTLPLSLYTLYQLVK